MGNKVSSVHGVKSPDFYAPGNGVNEIWIDNFELVSRLPFGDSDLGQAGWPSHDWPKIPWHQFIIPLKRDLGVLQNANMSLDMRMEFLKPRTFQIDTACSNDRYATGVIMIGLGWMAFLGHIYLMLLLLWDSLLYNQREPFRHAPTSFLLINFFFVVVGSILVGIGYPMALSAASCVNPIEVFQAIMVFQGVCFLFNIIGIWTWLGYSLLIAFRKRDGLGGAHGLAADASNAQRPVDFNVPMTHLQRPDQSTNTPVDVEKAIESTIATSEN